MHIVRCLICEEELVKVLTACKGMATHCGTSQKFKVYEDGHVDSWEHSVEAYDPSPIYASPTLSLQEKEAKLARLSAKLVTMEREHRHVILNRLHRTTDLLKKVRKGLMSSAAAEAAKDKTQAFENIRFNFHNKVALNKVWCMFLLQWAGQNTKEDLSTLERKLKDINLAVKFAVKHKIEVPTHLEHLKNTYGEWR